MIKWFEGNPVGVVLASVCTGLLLVLLLLAVVWSLPPSAPATDADSDDSVLALDVPELGDSEPLEAYTVITERPVFNASRQPVIEEDPADSEADDLLAEEEVDAPDVELSGVIITPTVRMVTLKTKDQPESLVAFEGQPLEGNYGSWQVSQIRPREITLSSSSGEEVNLKLQVHDVKIEQPPGMEPGTKGDKAGQAESSDDSDQPLSRAEEIRQRIAQRREELRRAAEEREPGQTTEVDYRNAIQSMMSPPDKQEEQDENE